MVWRSWCSTAAGRLPRLMPGMKPLLAEQIQRITGEDNGLAVGLGPCFSDARLDVREIAHGHAGEHDSRRREG